jgi:hypothetical protein
MSTGEGANPRGEAAPREDRRADRIGVGGGDDSVSRIQLAARWAEAYAADADSLVSVLKRFRTAYEYLDAVIHGVDPPELESEASASSEPAYAAPQWSNPAPPPAAPQGAPPPPPWARPTEPGAPPPAPPPAEPRPWG